MEEGLLTFGWVVTTELLKELGFGMAIIQEFLALSGLVQLLDLPQMLPILIGVLLAE